MNKNWKAATLAVQGGYEAKDGEPRVAPIVQSTTYRYDTTQSVADLFDLKREGFFYSRLANPTVDVMEKKIAALEGGVAAVALSSGQTANTLAILNIAKSGDHVVASAALYGGTVNLFAVTLPKMGINVTMVDADASEAEIVAAVRRGHVTLDGVKFRTRAGMGRCQGGFCAPKIMQIISRESGIPMEELTKRGPGSELLIGKLGSLEVK